MREICFAEPGKRGGQIQPAIRPDDSKVQGGQGRSRGPAVLALTSGAAEKQGLTSGRPVPWETPGKGAKLSKQASLSPPTRLKTRPSVTLRASATPVLADLRIDACSTCWATLRHTQQNSATYRICGWESAGARGRRGGGEGQVARNFRSTSALAKLRVHTSTVGW